MANDNDLLQALNSQTKAFDSVIWGGPDFPEEIPTEIHYSQWEWNDCKVRRYLEDGDFWVLLPGFNFWLQVSSGGEEP